ncbi:MAG TPA: UDP-2,3-diacylglucosamine diphosphatase [Ignavibacteria bacterium]
MYYFISDVHLGFGSREVNREKEKILIRFLEEIRKDAKEIFIVGDLFDFWIEYRQVVPKGHYRLLTKISEIVESGIKINYFSGNHDFWRGKYFKAEFGIEIINVPIEIEIKGKKFFISHGDGLSFNDTGYKILKKILQNRVSQFLYSWVHPDIGIWLAKKSSSTSRDYTSQKDYSKKDGMTEFAEQKTNEGFDFVIFGHRHFPLRKDFQNGTYINLGDWIRNFSYGVFEEGKFTLARYYDKKNNKFLSISEGEVTHKN